MLNHGLNHSYSEFEPQGQATDSAVAGSAWNAPASGASKPDRSGCCGRSIRQRDARQLDINRKTVMLWRGRFAEQGMESLWEVAPGRGRKPTYGPEKIKAIVDATLQTKPKGMTQWSCLLMAERQEVSRYTVSNIRSTHTYKL